MKLCNISPREIREKIRKGETFVINVVTDWCPDCAIRQRPHLTVFIEELETAGLSVFLLSVQKERLQFLSDEHRALTEEFGGHGYPRTVLIIKGSIQSDSRVEVVTPEALTALADEWIKRVEST
ncbi:periplasmic thioredoxin of cytochrome c-type biogenesis [bacterium]|nr:periplasmic thioredoxin of cytochrome c-type biogenesis [bacterium]